MVVSGKVQIASFFAVGLPIFAILTNTHQIRENDSSPDKSMQTVETRDECCLWGGHCWRAASDEDGWLPVMVRETPSHSRNPLCSFAASASWSASAVLAPGQSPKALKPIVRIYSPSSKCQKANLRVIKLTCFPPGRLSNTSHDCTSTRAAENMWFRMRGGRWCCQLFWQQSAIRVT